MSNSRLDLSDDGGSVSGCLVKIQVLCNPECRETLKSGDPKPHRNLENRFQRLCTRRNTSKSLWTRFVQNVCHSNTLTNHSNTLTTHSRTTRTHSRTTVTRTHSRTTRTHSQALKHTHEPLEHTHKHSNTLTSTRLVPNVCVCTVRCARDMRGRMAD